MTGTLEHVDPATMVIGETVREGALSAHLLASVHEHGVLQPITAARCRPRVGELSQLI